MGEEEARRGAIALALVVAALTSLATAAPLSDSTEIESYDEEAGCYYNFQHYGEGDRIMTNEPCLNCTCHNRMLMCYLRVCPFTKPIGQDCVVEKRGDQCCPIITCPDVPVDLIDSTTVSTVDSTEVGHHDNYGCSIDGRFYSDGAQVPSKQNKPCELCYCIRNMTACVMQECTLHVEGCTPVYQRGVCCPVRYSCDHPEDEGPLMIDDMTTTVRPTPGFILTTTLTPGYTMECTHHDEIIADGAMIATDKACEHCYCMKGDMVCAVQECGTPMENEGKNCTALPPRAGQCCPDTYICDGEDNSSTVLPESVDEATTESKIEQELEVSKHEEEPTTKSVEVHKPEGESDITHTTLSPDVSKTTVGQIGESTQIHDHKEDEDKSEENVTEHKKPLEKLPQHRDEISGEDQPEEHEMHQLTEETIGDISSTEKQAETHDDSNKDISTEQQTVIPDQDEIHQTTGKTNEPHYDIVTEIASTEINKHIALDSVTESYDKDDSSEHITKSETTPKQEEVTTHQTITLEPSLTQEGDDFEQQDIIKQQEEIYPQQEIVGQEQEKITPPTQLFTSTYGDHTKPNIGLGEKEITESPLHTTQEETVDSDLHVTKSPEELEHHDVKEILIPDLTDSEKEEFDNVFGNTESPTTSQSQLLGSTLSESDHLNTRYTEEDETNVDKSGEVTIKQILPVTGSEHDVTTESEKSHTSISHDHVTGESESEESSGDGNEIDDSGIATTIESIDSMIHSTKKDSESHTEKSVKSDTELEKETPVESSPEITTVHSDTVTSIPSISIGDGSSDVAPDKHSTEQDVPQELSTDKQIIDTVTVATHQQEERVTLHSEDSYDTTSAPEEIGSGEIVPKATTLHDLVEEVTTIVNEVKKSDDKKQEEDIQHTTEIYASEDDSIVTQVGEDKTDIPEEAIFVTESTKKPYSYHDHTIKEIIHSTTTILPKFDEKEPQEDFTTTHSLIEEEKDMVKVVEATEEEQTQISLDQEKDTSLDQAVSGISEHDLTTITPESDAFNLNKKTERPEVVINLTTPHEGEEQTNPQVVQAITENAEVLKPGEESNEHTTLVIDTTDSSNMVDESHKLDEDDYHSKTTLIPEHETEINEPDKSEAEISQHGLHEDDDHQTPTIPSDHTDKNHAEDFDMTTVSSIKSITDSDNLQKETRIPEDQATEIIHEYGVTSSPDVEIHPEEGTTALVEDDKIDLTTPVSIIIDTTTVSKIASAQSDDQSTPVEEEIKFATTAPQVPHASQEDNKDTPQTQLPEQATTVSDISDKYETISPVTEINELENEIHEDHHKHPVVEEPSRVPGEGDCLVDGITYRNNARIPTINKCQTACQCVNSILKCDHVECSPPPSNMVNCQPIYHGKDTCCPMYTCEHESVTIESDNQMYDMSTRAPEQAIHIDVTQKPIVNEDILHEDIVPEQALEKDSVKPIIIDSTEQMTTQLPKEQESGPDVPVDEEPFVSSIYVPDCGTDDCKIAKKPVVSPIETTAKPSDNEQITEKYEDKTDLGMTSEKDTTLHPVIDAQTIKPSFDSEQQTNVPIDHDQTTIRDEIIKDADDSEKEIHIKHDDEIEAHEVHTTSSEHDDIEKTTPSQVHDAQDEKEVTDDSKKETVTEQINTEITTITTQDDSKTTEKNEQVTKTIKEVEREPMVTELSETDLEVTTEYLHDISQHTETGGDKKHTENEMPTESSTGSGIDNINENETTKLNDSIHKEKPTDSDISLTTLIEDNESTEKTVINEVNIKTPTITPVQSHDDTDNKTSKPAYEYTTISSDDVNKIGVSVLPTDSVDDISPKKPGSPSIGGCGHAECQVEVQFTRHPIDVTTESAVLEDCKSGNCLDQHIIPDITNVADCGENGCEEDDQQNIITDDIGKPVCGPNGCKHDDYPIIIPSADSKDKVESTTIFIPEVSQTTEQSSLKPSSEIKPDCVNGVCTFEDDQHQTKDQDSIIFPDSCEGHECDDIKKPSVQTEEKPVIIKDETQTTSDTEDDSQATTEQPAKQEVTTASKPSIEESQPSESQKPIDVPIDQLLEIELPTSTDEVEKDKHDNTEILEITTRLPLDIASTEFEKLDDEKITLRPTVIEIHTDKPINEVSTEISSDSVHTTEYYIEKQETLNPQSHVIEEGSGQVTSSDEISSEPNEDTTTETIKVVKPTTLVKDIIEKPQVTTVPHTSETTEIVDNQTVEIPTVESESKKPIEELPTVIPVGEENMVATTEKDVIKSTEHEVEEDTTTLKEEEHTKIPLIPTEDNYTTIRSDADNKPTEQAVTEKSVGKDEVEQSEEGTTISAEKDAVKTPVEPTDQTAYTEAERDDVNRPTIQYEEDVDHTTVRAETHEVQAPAEHSDERITITGEKDEVKKPSETTDEVFAATTEREDVETSTVSAHTTIISDKDAVKTTPVEQDDVNKPIHQTEEDIIQGTIKPEIAETQKPIDLSENDIVQTTVSTQTNKVETPAEQEEIIKHTTISVEKDGVKTTAEPLDEEIAHPTISAESDKSPVEHPEEDMIHTTVTSDRDDTKKPIDQEQEVTYTTESAERDLVKSSQQFEDIAHTTIGVEQQEVQTTTRQPEEDMVQSSISSEKSEIHIPTERTEENVEYSTITSKKDTAESDDVTTPIGQPEEDIVRTTISTERDDIHKPTDKTTEDVVHTTIITVDKSDKDMAQMTTSYEIKKDEIKTTTEQSEKDLAHTTISAERDDDNKLIEHSDDDISNIIPSEEDAIKAHTEQPVKDIVQTTITVEKDDNDKLTGQPEEQVTVGAVTEEQSTEDIVYTTVSTKQDDTKHQIIDQAEEDISQIAIHAEKDEMETHTVKPEQAHQQTTISGESDIEMSTKHSGEDITHTTVSAERDEVTKPFDQSEQDVKHITVSAERDDITKPIDQSEEAHTTVSAERDEATKPIDESEQDVLHTTAGAKGDDDTKPVGQPEHDVVHTTASAERDDVTKPIDQSVQDVAPTTVSIKEDEVKKPIDMSEQAESHTTASAEEDDTTKPSNQSEQDVKHITVSVDDVTKPIDQSEDAHTTVSAERYDVTKPVDQSDDVAHTTVSAERDEITKPIDHSVQDIAPTTVSIKEDEVKKPIDMSEQAESHTTASAEEDDVNKPVDHSEQDVIHTTASAERDDTTKPVDQSEEDVKYITERVDDVTKPIDQSEEAHTTIGADRYDMTKPVDQSEDIAHTTVSAERDDFTKPIDQSKQDVAHTTGSAERDDTAKPVDQYEQDIKHITESVDDVTKPIDQSEEAHTSVSAERFDVTKPVDQSDDVAHTTVSAEKDEITKPIDHSVQDVAPTTVSIKEDEVIKPIDMSEQAESHTTASEEEDDVTKPVTQLEHDVAHTTVSAERDDVTKPVDQSEQGVKHITDVTEPIDQSEDEAHTTASPEKNDVTKPIDLSEEAHTTVSAERDDVIKPIDQSEQDLAYTTERDGDLVTVMKPIDQSEQDIAHTTVSADSEKDEASKPSEEEFTSTSEEKNKVKIPDEIGEDDIVRTEMPIEQAEDEITHTTVSVEKDGITKPNDQPEQDKVYTTVSAEKDDITKPVDQSEQDVKHITVTTDDVTKPIDQSEEAHTTVSAERDDVTRPFDKSEQDIAHTTVNTESDGVTVVKPIDQSEQDILHTTISTVRDEFTTPGAQFEKDIANVSGSEKDATSKPSEEEITATVINVEKDKTEKPGTEVDIVQTESPFEQSEEDTEHVTVGAQKDEVMTSIEQSEQTTIIAERDEVQKPIDTVKSPIEQSGEDIAHQTVSVVGDEVKKPTEQPETISAEVDTLKTPYLEEDISHTTITPVKTPVEQPEKEVAQTTDVTEPIDKSEEDIRHTTFSTNIDLSKIPIESHHGDDVTHTPVTVEGDDVVKPTGQPEEDIVHPTSKSPIEPHIEEDVSQTTTRIVTDEVQKPTEQFEKDISHTTISTEKDEVKKPTEQFEKDISHTTISTEKDEVKKPTDKYEEDIVHTTISTDDEASKPTDKSGEEVKQTTISVEEEFKTTPHIDDENISSTTVIPEHVDVDIPSATTEEAQLVHSTEKEDEEILHKTQKPDITLIPESLEKETEKPVEDVHISKPSFEVSSETSETPVSPEKRPQESENLPDQHHEDEQSIDKLPETTPYSEVYNKSTEASSTPTVTIHDYITSKMPIVDETTETVFHDQHPISPSKYPETVIEPDLGQAVIPSLPNPDEDEDHQVPQIPSYGSHGSEDQDYEEEDQAFGPGTCRYGGKVYVSAQQIPRDDPCDFCFCFRSDIICLQQSCPPPIQHCHEEPIQGFCCPRYECPVSMATVMNVTTTTTTTTTTLPPHFLSHAYKGQAQRRGCQVKGQAYQVGEVIKQTSGPCLHCTCGRDGQMKCDPKVCTPEPMLRQMIAVAATSRRR